MSNKKLLIYISTILATLIPCPGRFAFGILLVIIFNIIFLLAVLINHLFIKLEITEFSKFLMPVAICSLVMLFYQLLVFFSPILAIQLSFILYIQAFSIYLMVFMFDEENILPLKEDIHNQLYKCFWYSSLTLSFTLIREVLGYGCISFPSFSGLYPIYIFNIGSLTFMNFFASIPGATIICAFAISILLHFNSLKSLPKGESDE